MSPSTPFSSAFFAWTTLMTSWRMIPPYDMNSLIPILVEAGLAGRWRMKSGTSLDVCVFSTMVAALALTSFLVGFHLGPVFAIAQTVARTSMRALASAIILLTATCFGQGVGPLAVGVVNDALKGSYGADAVRYSLLSAAVTTTLGALLFVWAARTIRADIQRAS